MKPAIKTKTGKVVTAPKAGMRHVEIGVKGQRGFTDHGKFLNRAEAAKKANIKGVKSLHSEDLPAYKAKHK
jgi:hypothetical protein